MIRKLVFGLLVLSISLYLFNASWVASPPPSDGLKINSHRGVHQTFDRTNLGRDECTATRIFVPEHPLQENTISSMAAAFAAGAAIVEIDIHPTTDGHFAVFHDWTVDCRTNGSGVTRKHSLKELQTLDIGHGYTADDGKTFPFRGKAIGKMPSLRQVLNHFPTGQFLVNFKSRDAREADHLELLLREHPAWKSSIWGVYGGDPPTQKMQQLEPDLRAFTKTGVKSCLKEYIALGWSGFVPHACRNTQVLVPSNYAKWLWGWPNRFLQRMYTNGTEVILSGPPGGTGGIDTLDQLSEIPVGFRGYVWTNKIEIIGPKLKQDFNGQNQSRTVASD
jgi:glycerophosphoryl diester phosphodiesterase